MCVCVYVNLIFFYIYIYIYVHSPPPFHGFFPPAPSAGGPASQELTVQAAPSTSGSDSACVPSSPEEKYLKTNDKVIKL